MPERGITSLWKLKPGDHIKRPTKLNKKTKKKSVSCDHHYLVIRVLSDSEVFVIHNDGESVKEEETEFHPGQITVLEYPCCYSPDEAIARARSRLGGGYDLLTNNCEHFVTWAKTGKGISYQVIKATAAGTVGAAGLGLYGALGGAAFGSMVPVVGTAVGAAVGGAIGGVYGLIGGVIAALEF